MNGSRDYQQLLRPGAPSRIIYACYDEEIMTEILKIQFLAQNRASVKNVSIYGIYARHSCTIITKTWKFLVYFVRLHTRECCLWKFRSRALITQNTAQTNIPYPSIHDTP